MKKARKYDKDFKISICKMVLDDKISVNVISKEYSMSDTMIHRWVREYKTYGDDAFVGCGNLPPANAKIKQLEKELEEAKMEIEILKKTKKFFLQQQNKE